LHQRGIAVAKHRVRNRFGLLSSHNVTLGVQAAAAAHCAPAIGYRSSMELSLVDRWLCGAEVALRTLSGGIRAERATPSPEPLLLRTDVPADVTAPVPPTPAPAPALSAEERRLSGALMRVNHVGEVCAQALYQAQALATSNAGLKARMDHAAREEIDHLAWTAQRLAELGDRPSLLNPLWFGGAFLIGLAAGRLGDRVSLGFVVETERQVEHAIVAQMQSDEAAHAVAAQRAGGIELPAPVRGAMRLAAKVMTATAHYV
jgi:ubiquinone biosynthesis monooxygenase Coq7